MALSNPLARQILLGAPKGAMSAEAGGTPGQVKLTITANEPGTMHLDTMVLSAGAGAAQNAPFTLIDAFTVSSALVYGSIELVRGRNSPNVPAGAFSGYRGTNQITWGDWPVQAGDTFAVTLDNNIAEANASDCTLSCAFSPTNQRMGVLQPGGPCTYAGSPLSDTAASADGSCVITFDEAGVFSLSSLQMVAGLNLTADAAAGVGQFIDGASTILITDIELPTGNKLLVGNGTNAPVMSGESFAAAHRSYSWAELGSIAVSSSDTITVSYSNINSSAAATVSIGGRFYPLNPTRPIGKR
jgi:hypothetical protein